jgi:large repetitive protein
MLSLHIILSAVLALHGPFKAGTPAIPSGNCSIQLAAVTTRPLCHGQTNGAINLSISGGLPPYAFSWTGPTGFSAGTEDLVNIGSGTYTVTVTDGAGCIRTQSFNVGSPAPLDVAAHPILLPQGHHISCHGGSNGAAMLTVNGGTAPYSTTWHGTSGLVSQQQNPTGLPAGTYTATVTDLNGCMANTSITLLQPEPLLVSTEVLAQPSCAGDASGSATVSATGGMAPYSFIWGTSPIQTSAQAVGLSGGNTTVTVTDAYGCSSMATVTIHEPAPLFAQITSLVPVEPCQGQTDAVGSATVAAAGGTAPYTFLWNSTPVQTSSTAVFTSGGTYIVTITDGNGCIAEATAIVPEVGSSSIILSGQVNVACSGGSTGSATVALAGSSAIQSITWNSTPSQSGTNLTGVPAGSYTATALHGNGCQSSTTVTITEPAPLSAPQIITNAGLTCHGNTAELTVTATGGTAPYTYSTAGSSSAATLTGLTPGALLVVVTDAAGCTNSASVLVPGPTAPLTATISAFTNELCTGTALGTATVEASGGTAPYAYQWNSTPAQTGANATDIPQGSYTVTVTDANGCTATTGITIGGPQFGIDGMLEAYGHETCFGAHDAWATISVWGGSNSFTATWNTTPPITGFTATGLAPGSYAIEVVDNLGCGNSKFFYIDLGGPSTPLTTSLALSDHAGWNISCPGAEDGSIDLTITGGQAPYSHHWMDSFNNVSGAEDLNGLPGGTYQLTVIDAFGCVLHEQVQLIEPPPLHLEFTPGVYGNGHAITCAGAVDGSIILGISGGNAPYAIAWSTTQGFSASTPTITGLAAGVYDVSVTDASGCQANGSVTLTAPAAIGLAFSSSLHNGHHISCAGGNDGNILLTATGGSTPYSVSWNTGASSFSLSGLAAGTYTATVTDVNGCGSTASHVLTEPSPLLVSAAQNLHPGGFGTSCASASDGSITTTMAGGMPPYSVHWTGPGGYSSTSASPTGLAAGTYMLTVVDASGCAYQQPVMVTAPAPLSVSLNSITYNGGYHIRCAGASTGSIQTGISGGVGNHLSSWAGPNGFTATNASLTGLAAGTYTLSVSDGNGCTDTASITLIEPELMLAQITTSDAGNGHEVGCAGNDGSISVTVNGGTPAHEFSWNGPDGFGSIHASIGALPAGIYTLVVMDANGCTVEETSELTAIEPLSILFTSTTNACAGDGTAAIDATVIGGTGEHSLLWSGPDGFTANTPSISGLTAGTYQLQVEDAGGCSAVFTHVLIDPAPLQLIVEAPDHGVYNLRCHADSSGTLLLTAAGGTAPFTFHTNGPGAYSSDQAVQQQLAAGNYSTQVTDANGCTTSATVLLTEPPAVLSASLTASLYPGGTHVACHGGSDGAMETSVDGGVPPYSFTWNGPDGSTSDQMNITEASAGLHQLVVVDANTCSLSVQITLTQPDAPLMATVTTSDHGGHGVSCSDASDGSIAISVSGGTGDAAIVWTGPGGFTSTESTIGGLVAGVYSAQITDLHGCTLQVPVALSAPSPLQITLTTIPISCHGMGDGQLHAEIGGGTGPLLFTWTGGAVPEPTQLDQQQLQAGTYCLALSDANGCAAQQCATILEPSPLQATATTTPDACGTGTGTIVLDITGGTSPHDVVWSNGASGILLNDLAAGGYSASISDQNGCITALAVTVHGTDAVNAIADIVHVQCNGESSGAIDLTITGGTAPFTHAWSTGSVMEDVSGLSAGMVQLLITDANGCSFSGNYTVEQAPALQVEVTTSMHAHGHAIGTFNGTDGSIALDVSGGMPPYSFLWSGQGTGAMQSGLAAGTYTVQVIDGAGCSRTLDITLTAPQDLEMPTAFSPNGDGHNEFFVIRGLEAYPSNTFTVFNRWGNVVYDRLNYRNNWDGLSSMGGELPSGTYFVILTVNQGTRTLQGYVDMRR